MPDLITTTDLDDRNISYADAAEATAAIADASAIARSYTAPILDSGTVDEVIGNVPAEVVAVVCAMVRRGLTNPRGLSQETLGDYSYAAGANAVATMIPTRREKVILRRAATVFALAQSPALDVPVWSVGSPYMEADLPANSEATDWGLN